MIVSSVNNNNYNINKKPSANVAFTGESSRIATFFSKHTDVNEGTSIALDFIGKAIVAPIFIMFNPISKEPQDKKKYAALKNPVAGLIQLAMEAPIFLLGSKHIETEANKGRFGKYYNLKLAEDNAKAEILAKAAKDGIKLTEKALKDEIKELSKPTKTRLSVLQSRSCFIASLVLTPIMCSLENYLHPKLMKHLDLRKEEKVQKTLASNNTRPAEVKKNAN